MKKPNARRMRKSWLKRKRSRGGERKRRKRRKKRRGRSRGVAGDMKYEDSGQSSSPPPPPPPPPAYSHLLQFIPSTAIGQSGNAALSIMPITSGIRLMHPLTPSAPSMSSLGH